MIIGLDFDDIVFSFNNTFYAYHNKKYGTNIGRQDITTFDIEKILNCTLEEVKSKVFEFVATPEHATALPVEGAQEALALLSKEHELHIITARGDQLQDVTFTWIEKNFPKHFESVTLTNQFFGLPDKKVTKVEVSKRLGVKVMIEDSLSNARDISSAGFPVILLDTPWNQSEPLLNVTRVKTWKEIVDEIDTIAAHEA